MSFILDALKKSETDRQQQTGAEFANVPTGSEERHPYKWLWILALLLLVNFAALMIVLLRPGTESQQPSSDAEPPIEAVASQSTAMPEPSFEEQVAEARETHAERSEAEIPPPEPEVQSTPAPQPVRTQPAPRVKSIHELRAEGRLQVAELHLDIHVFSENRDERFVFINMAKHREGSRLAEGPVVNEITPEGVILDHQGMTFLLPRE
jgi:general secretion pathway protein B